ncbi:MAG: isocitrate/isopropylmalate dehydrogenase family protein, partial [bacterium]|nr:isocitrate/isopropylmalate dehydrogenase family protein [bacterium]
MASPKRKVVMIEGDGIGPEICAAVRTVIAATGAPIEWVMADAGLGALERTGTPLPGATIALLMKNRVGIKGPTDTPSGGGHRSVNVGMRMTLDLYTCVRLVRSLGAHHRLAGVYPNVDIVIVRENTEGLYAGLEARGDSPAGEELRQLLARHFGREFGPGARFGIKFYTPEGTERIIRYAFEYARKHKRKKVTLLDKANIQKVTDGLWLEVFNRIKAEYPDIVADRRIIDAGSGRLVRAPEDFDVIVADSLYGDIVSDIAAELVGGLGLAPGANIGDEYALFEATHGTAPDIAGKDLANPTSLLLSACMMLDHLAEIDAREHPAVGDQWGYDGAAANLRTAIERVIRRGDRVTPDIWPKR